ncbi:methyltransferase domain-containing protein [Cyclospora cayetanensis]|uniref:Methyltransferase domain-containing protein n=1 Tax=Cyclospora cayetanensis TaxID=88456 RepID=A0A1D3DAR2_9EIME|nr:methyltransferase domain-containing protein [Cyclospora cayetanensis]
MAYLPATLAHFRERSYWDNFFKSRGGEAFEWYGTFCDFREAFGILGLLRGAPKADEGSQEGPLLLHVGCGNSTLPRELYEEGYKRIVNIDFSPVVIEEMKARFAALPSLEWRCLDVRGKGLQEAFLGPPGGSGPPPFDIVLDKGFLDAFISIDHEEALLAKTGPSGVPPAGMPAEGTSEGSRSAKVSPASTPYDYKKAASEYFEAVMEVLKEGGSYILISLLQDYLLKEFVRFFLTRHVTVEIFPCRTGDPKMQGSAFAGRLQPFLIRVKKEAPPSGGALGVTPQVPTCTMAGTPGREGPETFPLWELTKHVAAVSRWFALDALARSQSPGKRAILHVGGGGGPFARCSVAVYDTTNQAHAKKGKTAALLVPPGQELTWTFATSEGNQQIADQLETSRLLVVTFPLGFGSDALQEVAPVQWHRTIEEAQKTLGPLLKEFSLPTEVGSRVVLEGKGGWCCFRGEESQAGARELAEKRSLRLSLFLGGTAQLPAGELGYASKGGSVLMAIFPALDALGEPLFAAFILAPSARDTEGLWLCYLSTSFPNCADPLFAEDAIPILTLGEQAPVREVLWQQSSPLAGRILVRDVQDTTVLESAAAAGGSPEGATSTVPQTKRKAKQAKRRKERDSNYQRLMRQLLFSCNPNTLQSELKLRVPKGVSSTDASQVEFLTLDPASAYYCAIVTAFGLSKKVVTSPWGSINTIDAVLLGGGVLGGMLHRLFGSFGLSLTCVELDAVVIQVAKQFFGFKESESPRLRTVCGEGKQYVEALPPESLDLLIIDINSGETADAVICPPKAFAEAEFLQTAKEKLRPGGVFISNLLCRSEETKKQLLDSVKKEFPFAAVIDVPEDVNEVAVAVKDGPSPQNGQNLVSSSELFKRLQHLVRTMLLAAHWHQGGMACWTEYAGLGRPD